MDYCAEQRARNGSEASHCRQVAVAKVRDFLKALAKGLAARCSDIGDIQLMASRMLADYPDERAMQYSVWKLPELWGLVERPPTDWGRLIAEALKED